MKNTLSKSIAAIALSLLMVTCAKEKQETLNQTGPITDKQLIERVNWFSEAANDLKDGKYLKSGEKMLIEDAVYNISAALNINYGFPEQILSHTLLDETIINVPLIGTEGKTYVVDALSGYNQARSTIKNHVLALNKLNLKTLGFVVENLGLNNSSTAIMLKITTQIGYGSIVQPGSQSTTAGDWGFTADDQHWWQRNSYNCFNYNPEDTRGAPEVIEGTLMFGYIPAPQPNCRYAYPTLYTKNFNPIEYQVDVNPDLFCDYKIFYVQGTWSQIMTDQVQCLGLDAAHPGVHEMAFYTTGLKEIIDGFLALPANQNFKCQKIYIASPPATQINSTLWYINHAPTLYYGLRQTICYQPAFDITTYVD